MNTQNYYGLIINWVNAEKKIDRWLLQSILQHMFQTELKGKDLTDFINDMNIMSLDMINLRNGKLITKEEAHDWWKHSFAITKINMLS
jgi:hypothetical protein